jgi:5-methylcytosine-specific restriction endonuclease McrA
MWQDDNRNKVNAAIERYHKGHPEQKRYWQHKAYRKFYVSDKGKEIWRRLNDKRRALQKGAEGHFSPQDIRNQYDKQSGKCFWCSKMVGNVFHVDHIIPLSRWGTNWPSNIVISCPFCNDSKGNKMPFQEWFPVKCLGR